MIILALLGQAGIVVLRASSAVDCTLVSTSVTRSPLSLIFLQYACSLLELWYNLYLGNLNR